MHERLSIGDLARETGVKVVTIRYYERIGLLPIPVRTGSGAYRSYGNAVSRPPQLHSPGS